MHFLRRAEIHDTRGQTQEVIRDLGQGIVVRSASERMITTGNRASVHIPGRFHMSVAASPENLGLSGNTTVVHLTNRMELARGRRYRDTAYPRINRAAVHPDRANNYTYMDWLGRTCSVVGETYLVLPILMVDECGSAVIFHGGPCDLAPGRAQFPTQAYNQNMLRDWEAGGSVYNFLGPDAYPPYASIGRYSPLVIHAGDDLSQVFRVGHDPLSLGFAQLAAVSMDEMRTGEDLGVGNGSPLLN